MLSNVTARLAGKLRGAAHRLEAMGKAERMPVELPYESEVMAIWEQVRARTMTSIERIDALVRAARYVHQNDIPGDIVECGVWRGGSMMATALMLGRLGGRRRLHLFDTFEGMTEPTSEDADFSGASAAGFLADADSRTSHVWARASFEDVREGMAETGYPSDLISYVKGPVEETIPQAAPQSIAILRLDTDWYSSTRHELVHLWPRLAPGGILIVDDYGSWAGAKKAVDEYFSENGLAPYMHRIDGAGRLVVRP